MPSSSSSALSRSNLRMAASPRSAVVVGELLLDLAPGDRLRGAQQEGRQIRGVAPPSAWGDDLGRAPTRPQAGAWGEPPAAWRAARGGWGGRGLLGLPLLAGRLADGVDELLVLLAERVVAALQLGVPVLGDVELALLHHVDAPVGLEPPLGRLEVALEVGGLLADLGELGLGLVGPLLLGAKLRLVGGRPGGGADSGSAAAWAAWSAWARAFATARRPRPGRAPAPGPRSAPGPRAPWPAPPRRRPRPGRRPGGW